MGHNTTRFPIFIPASLVRPDGTVEASSASIPGETQRWRAFVCDAAGEVIQGSVVRELRAVSGIPEPTGWRQEWGWNFSLTINCRRIRRRKINAQRLSSDSRENHKPKKKIAWVFFVVIEETVSFCVSKIKSGGQKQLCPPVEMISRCNHATARIFAWISHFLFIYLN